MQMLVCGQDIFPLNVKHDTIVLNKAMDNRKKILYVITKSNFGGAQRYVYDLATNLPKSDFDIAVVLGGEGRLKEMLMEAGIRAIPVKNLERDIRITDEFSSFFSIFNIFRKEKPNIVHLNSSKAAGLGALAGRFTKVQNIIFTAHGWAFNEERSAAGKIIIKFLAWLTIALSHKTIAVSEKILKEAPLFLIPKTKIELIYNGVRKTGILPKNEARKMISKKIIRNIPNNFIVGVIAELHNNKGLIYFIEAAAMLKQIYPKNIYIIIGEGEERKSLEKLIKRHNLEKTLYLPGFMDNAPNYLSAFDIFVLPSITEALGLSILEAGRAGLPVIAASVGGIPEIIEDMKNGILVRPRQPKELSSAIKFLMDNPKKAADFGKNLQNKVINNFSLEEMLSKTFTLYNRGVL